LPILHIVVAVTLVLILGFVAIYSLRKYRDFKLIVRYFLHDLGNYMTTLTIFQDYFEMQKGIDDQNQLKVLQDENRVLIDNMRDHLFVFSGSFQKGLLGKKDVDEVDFCELLEKHKDSLLRKGMLKRKYAWKFSIPETPIILKTNMHLLNSMLGNLFCNIRKYAKEGSEISVTLKNVDDRKHATLVIQNEKDLDRIAKNRKGQGLYFIKKFSPQLHAKVNLSESENQFKTECHFRKGVK
ncbi:hypothetical protein ACFL3C_05000, partial [Patescibacteria group bacterium]